MKKKLTDGAICFAIFVLFCFALSPYLTNGYWGDDALNSSMAGNSARTGRSVWSFAWFINGCWMRDSGRFFPLSWLIGYHSHYLLQPVEHYRFYQCSLVFAHMWLFARLLFELSGSKRLAYCVAFALPVFFQIREYHDPIGSYGGLLQLIGLYVTGSVLMLVLHCRTNRYWQLVLSSLLYTAGLLSYELSFLALPLLWFALPIRAGIRRRFVVLLPALAITCGYFALVSWVRHHSSTVYAGITPSFDWTKWSVTFGRQLFAAVPFSYWTATWHKKLELGELLLKTGKSWTSWLVFGGTWWLLHRLFVKDNLSLTSGFRIGRMRQLLGIGLVLFIGPAALIALSRRYQDQVTWGVGYLPVYISYFGLATLVALALFWLIRHAAVISPGRIRHGLRWLIFGISALIAVNRTLNIAVAEPMNNDLKYNRDLIEAAAHSGLFDAMSNGDRLILVHAPHWVTEDFLFQHTERSVVLVALHSDTQSASTEITKPHSTYLLDYTVFDSTDRGWVMLAKVRPEHSNLAELATLRCKFPISGYSIFVRSPQEYPVLKMDHIPLQPVAPSNDNLLRRIYRLSRPRRYFAIRRNIAAGLTPCPSSAGELEIAYPLEAPEK